MFTGVYCDLIVVDAGPYEDLGDGLAWVRSIGRDRLLQGPVAGGARHLPGHVRAVVV